MYSSLTLFLQTWTINRKIIKKFCNAKKTLLKKLLFFASKKNGITEFFDNLSIDCSCLKKKYARKKIGGHHACFWNTWSKRPFWRQVVTSVAIATDSVVLKITEFKSRNINLSLVTKICQMKFKYAKSESQSAVHLNC